MQSGCGCRCENSLAHYECLAKKAGYQPHRGDASYRSCQTCLRPFTGEMRKQLAILWVEVSRLSLGKHVGDVSKRDEFMRAVSHMCGCILDEDNKGLNREGSLCWWYGWYDSVALIIFFLRENFRPESIPRTNPSLLRPFELTMDNMRTATSLAIKKTDLEQVIGWVTSAQYDRKALVLTGHLAMALSNMERFKESNRLFNVVIGEMVKVFGSRHPSTMQIEQHYALSLFQQELYQAAELANRQLLGVLMETDCGETNSSTMACITNLALCLIKQGKYTEAELRLNRLLSNRQRIFGNDHPSTCNIHFHLYDLMKRKRKLVEQSDARKRRCELACSRKSGPLGQRLGNLNHRVVLGEVRTIRKNARMYSNATVRVAAVACKPIKSISRGLRK
jgi:hypothetical protein